jgi:hypothetical protein
MQSASARRACLTLALDPRADGHEYETAGLGLLRELREQGIAFETTADAAASPQGAKDAGQAVSAGQILLSLAASGGVLVALISAVQAWLQRNAGKKVTIEIDGHKLELQGASSEQQEVLMRTFLSKLQRGD